MTYTFKFQYRTIGGRRLTAVNINDGALTGVTKQNPKDRDVKTLARKYAVKDALRLQSKDTRRKIWADYLERFKI